MLYAVGGATAAQHIVKATLTASLDSGSLAGTAFPVFFSYDASQASPQGVSFVRLETFDFTLLGVAFTLADIFQGGQVVLHDGQFRNVMASFQVLLPPNSPVQNITFGFGVDGVIGYLDWANKFGSGSFALATLKTVLNAASFANSQPIAPGSLVSMFGSGFCSKNAAAESVPLPFTLAGVSVRIGGIPAPLAYVSPSQVNVQVPWNVTTGAADVALTTNGATLPPVHVSIGPTSPGIFTIHGGNGQAIAFNEDWSLAGPEGSVPGVRAHPATIGDAIIIFATGLGSVRPTISNGAAPTDALRTTIATPTVLIAGVSAPVAFSGLSPEFVGVNQINVIVPSSVAAGVVPLQIDVAGIRTIDKVTIAVRDP